MHRLKCGLVMFTVLSIGGFQSFASPPITIKADSQYLEQLTPERRQVYDALVKALEAKGIEGLPDYQAALPETAVAEAQIVDFSDLFVQPEQEQDDIARLAEDEFGNQKTISAEQLESIRTEGVLKVPSVKAPGKFHLWRVNTLIQKGAKNIEFSFEEDVSSALRHVVVTIPDNLFATGSNQWSVRKGVKNIVYGLRGVLSNLVGLVEDRAMYSEYDIDRMIEGEKQAYIHRSLKGEQAQQFDDRLYNEKLVAELQPEIDRIERLHYTLWNAQEPALRREYLRTYRDQFPNKTRGQIQVLIDKQIEDLKVEALSKLLREDEGLNAVAPGFGVLLSNRRTAIRIAEEVEKNLSLEMTEKEEEIRDSLKKESPILSRIDLWLDRKVAAQKDAYYKSIRWERLGQIEARLNELGLVQEAYISHLVIAFQQEQEGETREKLANQRVAGKTYSFESRIWRSSKWEKEKDGNGDEVYPYRAVKYDTDVVSSDQWFWRLRIIGRETQADAKNGLYHLVYSNLVKGPVGFQALFNTEESFCTGKKMDPDTGEIVDSDDQCPTYVGNLKGIWKDVAKARKEFEDAPDRGLLGKKYTRWINKGWNYGVKGGLGTFVVGLGQPILTICNAAATCALSVATPAWAPFSSVFKWGLSASIYDVNSPGRSDSHSSYNWFPQVGHTLGDMAIAGVGQIAVKGVQTVAWDAPAFVVKGSYAYVRKGLRTAWDSFIRNQFLVNAKVPANDSFGAKRIQGPGLASHYYYQVEPEIALMALQASLEKEELQLFTASEKEKINKPLSDFYAFFAEVAQPVGRIDVSDLPEARALQEERDANHEDLNKQVKARTKVLDAASVLPHGINRSMIKLEQLDMPKTMAVAQGIVQSFYQDHLVKRLKGNAVEKFWQSRELDEGDFIGLTRYYFAEAFDNDFLVPFEKADDDFVIHVKEDRLKDVFAHFPLH